MARVKVPITILTTTGEPANGVSVSIAHRATGAAATLYSAESGGTSLGGSATTGTDGRLNAWVERGAYTATWSGTGLARTSDTFDAVPGGDATIDPAWLSAAALPPGVILPYGGGTPPADWPYLLCDGGAYSRTTYANLFAVIGTMYGAGDGTSTFNVPDMRGRVPMGSGSGPGLTARTRGQQGGAETHLLTGNESGVKAHGHSVSDPGHGHNMEGFNNGGNAPSLVTNNSRQTVRGMTAQGAGGTDAGFAYVTNGSFANAFGVANAGTGVAVNNHAGENAGAAHNNVQPFTVTNYIIKF